MQRSPIPAFAGRPRRSLMDGLGRVLSLEDTPCSIVSLVPSLTEALFAMGLRQEIVGRTAYCVEPVSLVDAIPTVGGTKTPDVARIIAMRPDLVIVSAEENAREHVEALIEAGLRVYVSLPTTVRRALVELADLATLTRREDDAAPWLADATAAVELLEGRRPEHRPSYFCPIWRRPYMVAAPNTYMTDFLRLCGGESIFGVGSAHYYAVQLDEAARRAPDIVLLPSEPYPFAEKHLPEISAYEQMPAVQAGRVHLIEGQWITWYGPRIASSLRAVAPLFEAA